MGQGVLLWIPGIRCCLGSHALSIVRRITINNSCLPNQFTMKKRVIQRRDVMTNSAPQTKLITGWSNIYRGAHLESESEKYGIRSKWQRYPHPLRNNYRQLCRQFQYPSDIMQTYNEIFLDLPFSEGHLYELTLKDSHLPLPSTKAEKTNKNRWWIIFFWLFLFNFTICISWERNRAYGTVNRKEETDSASYLHLEKILTNPWMYFTFLVSFVFVLKLTRTLPLNNSVLVDSIEIE